jgi:hypothetical protein
MITFMEIPSSYIIDSHSHTVLGDGTTNKTKSGRSEEGSNSSSTSTGIAIALHKNIPNPPFHSHKKKII